MININVDLTEFERLGPSRQRRVIKAIALLEAALETPMYVLDAPELVTGAVPDREPVEVTE